MRLNTISIGSHAETWGSCFGIAGALLLSLALPSSRWGWVLFLGSNVGWLIFAGAMRYRKLLLQQGVFTCTSLLGIANSFFPGNLIQDAIKHLAASL